jgi:hypothetical protein
MVTHGAFDIGAYLGFDVSPLGMNLAEGHVTPAGAGRFKKVKWLVELLPPFLKGIKHRRTESNNR